MTLTLSRNKFPYEINPVYGDEELTERFKEAIRIENEERRIKGEPVAKYDTVERRAYLEYPDGRRQYAN